MAAIKLNNKSYFFKDTHPRRNPTTILSGLGIITPILL
jgi:hypothetical protein